MAARNRGKVAFGSNLKMRLASSNRKCRPSVSALSPRSTREPNDRVAGKLLNQAAADPR